MRIDWMTYLFLKCRRLCNRNGGFNFIDDVCYVVFESSTLVFIDDVCYVVFESSTLP